MIGLQMDNKDPRLKAWQDAIPRVLASEPKGDGFITRSLSEEENDVLAMGFAKTMMSTSSKFKRCSTTSAKAKISTTPSAAPYGASPPKPP